MRGVLPGMKLRTASALAALAATLRRGRAAAPTTPTTAPAGAKQSADSAYGYDYGTSKQPPRQTPAVPAGAR